MTASASAAVAARLVDSDSNSDETNDGGISRSRYGRHGGHRWEVFVADPSRELKALTLTLKSTAARTGGSKGNNDSSKPIARSCRWSVPLPTGDDAGSTVKGILSCGMPML